MTWWLAFRAVFVMFGCLWVMSCLWAQVPVPGTSGTATTPDITISGPIVETFSHSMAEISDDGKVQIDWKETEIMAHGCDPGAFLCDHTSVAIARLMIAIRDGTYIQR